MDSIWFLFCTKNQKSLDSLDLDKVIDGHPSNKEQDERLDSYEIDSCDDLELNNEEDGRIISNLEKVPSYILLIYWQGGLFARWDLPNYPIYEYSKVSLLSFK